MAWSKWDYLGGNVVSRPSVINNAGGRLEVFAEVGEQSNSQTAPPRTDIREISRCRSRLSIIRNYSRVI